MLVNFASGQLPDQAGPSGTLVCATLYTADPGSIPDESNALLSEI